MNLSVTEAAAILGVSPRAVRGRLARGALAGRKVSGEWRVDRASLPLTDDQRARVAEVRAVVDAALPPAGAATRGDRSRSVADLDAFRLGAALLPAVQAAAPELGRALEDALVVLGRAVHTFHRAEKLAAVGDARAALSAVAARLHLRGAPMSWRDAPLYTRVHECVGGWSWPEQPEAPPSKCSPAPRWTWRSRSWATSRAP